MVKALLLSSLLAGSFATVVACNDNTNTSENPITAGDDCTLTQGYWKTHGPIPSGNNTNVWPVTALDLGTVNYVDLQLQSKLASDLRGDPAEILNRRRSFLHDENLLAAPSEQMRRDQRVDAGSDDDGVEAQARFPRIAAAALRPEAPMTPPPGCVPEPHCQSPSIGVR